MKTTKRILSFPYIENVERLLSKLQEYDKKGYELVDVGIFLTFQKAEINHKYQVVISPLSTLDSASMDEYGYEYLDTFGFMNVYKSQDLNAKDITIDHEKHKKHLLEKYNTSATLGYLLFFIIIVSLFTYSYSSMFKSKLNFILNAHHVSESFLLLGMSIELFALMLINHLKMKKIKENQPIPALLYHYDQIIYILSIVMLIIFVGITFYFKNSIIYILPFIFIFLVSSLTNYSYFINKSKNQFPLVINIVLLFAFFITDTVLSPLSNTTFISNEFPSVTLVSEINKSRYLYEIKTKEETTDVSWIDDVYLECQTREIANLLFENFVIQTERGVRFPNTNVFTNTTLEYELSEKAVPSLSFEKAMNLCVKIDEDVWTCGDYLIAKKDRLLVRIAFEDLNHAKERLSQYLVYYNQHSKFNYEE